MSDYFIFDGVDSRTFGAYVYDVETDSSPVNDYSAVTIPGRSGDFLLNNRRFPNVEHTYYVLFPTNFETNYSNLRAYLLSRNGYSRLEDSIHPTEFYQAYVNTPIRPEITRDRGMGKAKITFNRKPQRWLKSGENAIALALNLSNQTVTNPTRFSSYPLLYFHFGTSPKLNIKVNDTTIVKTNNATAANQYVYIDLETLQCYGRSSATSGTFAYYNQYINYDISDYAKAFILSPGQNTVKLNDIDGITSASIIPRWYTI